MRGPPRGDARLLPPPALALSASVVIATTGGRSARLRALLDSLEGQDVEVVVEEDRSGDGPAVVRNRGWRRASGSLVCFLDDDVVVAEGWVDAYLEAHRSDPAAVLQGRTEPLPAEAPLQNAFSRSKLIVGPNWNYATCNIAYPRALLERLGGFDEAYRFASAEDTDLGWRAREAGAPTVFVDGARAYHAVQHYGVVRLVQRMKIKQDVGRLTKRHPGLRHHYHRGVFWKRSHERLLVAAAGLALAPRTRGASLALLAPYAALYRDQHGSWPGTVASLAGHALVDGAETAAVTAGGIRHRTLLL